MVLENLEHAADILFVKTTNAQSILQKMFTIQLTSRGISKATHVDHVDSMHIENSVDV